MLRTCRERGQLTLTVGRPMDAAARRAHRRRQALIADACVALGARSSTVSAITGLPRRETRRLVVDEHEHGATRGNRPNSPDWLAKCNLHDRIYASTFLAIFVRIAECGVARDEALIAAYRIALQQLSRQTESADTLVDDGFRARINFDRAFALVSQLESIWGTKAPLLMLSTCRQCHCDYVHYLRIAAVALADCPFCALLARHRHDLTRHATFGPPPLPILSAAHFGLLNGLMAPRR